MKRVWFGLFVFFAGLLCFSFPPSVFAASPPTLFFTDLESGPKTGGENNNGAFVTIYGNNFGTSPTVTVGGGQVIIKLQPSTYLWYQKMTIQLGSNAATGNIVVTTSNGSSNGLPFTVRSGNIYFVATTGSDSAAGTFAAPFKTMIACKNEMIPGDTCYIEGGVVQKTQDNFSAALSIESSGTASMPYAMVAYPGASPQPMIDGTTVQYGIRVPNVGLTVRYWVFAGLKTVSSDMAIHANVTSGNWRVIGNYISCPGFNGQSGCFSANEADNMYFYGNEVTGVGVSSGSSKQSHSVYFSSDTNHVWVGWNHIHDNFSCRALQFHSSPLGGGGSSDPTGHNQYDLHVHDNLIHGDNCDGINFATVDPSQGVVEAYNNVIYNVGRQVPPDGGGNYTGIYVANTTNTGSAGSGIVQIYNNTIYNNGFANPGYAAWGQLGLASGPVGMNLRNNIIVSGSTNQPYFSGISDLSKVSGSSNLYFGNGNGPSQTTGNINANPFFISTSTPDFHLQSTSPAIGAGTAISSLLYDIEGYQRATPLDLGAYNYGTYTPDTTPPTLPSNFNLAASATSQSSITVSWNPATDDIGVTGYQVERCTGLSCTTFANVGNPTASPFVDSGLTASTGYSYHVRALDAAGNMSGWSNVVGATTQAPDTTPPSTPASLSATATSSSTIDLTWTASTDNVSVTGYKVERCQGSSCTNFSEITNQPITNYQDTGLSPSTTYRYQVRAVDGAGNNSAYSTIAQVTTQTPPPVSANMMAAYNFNENTGTTINDLSGHTNTGTASNATWTTGKNGSALSFNGSSSSVSVPDNNTLDITGSFTLSAWIYSSNLSGYRDVIIKGNNASNYYLETNGTNISFGFYQSGAWHEHNSTSANLQTNTWTHVAGVFDTDANTVTLYKNGVQIYQASETGTPPANTLPLTIGSGFSGENYGGSIDDVRVYNTALTQTDIQTDMNTPLTQPTSTVSCNTVTTTNFSQSAYNSYGAPFDAFQTSTNLIDAKCTSADTHTINLTTGVTGDTTRIVYTKGYYYDPVTAGWTQYSGTCTGALNGEWCQGSISATITNPNISTASAANPTYLVGMTCSVQGGGWKCGCRDTNCTNFYWQIQGAGM